MHLRYFIVLSLFFFITGFCFSQTKSSFIYYHEGDDVALKMDVFHPKNFSKDSTYPCIVFYFGGNWLSGKTGYFARQAKYFASRKMICFLPQYRTKNSHQATPKTSLKDAKTAMRYLKTHAKELCIDTTKIVAAGSSAGGHLAAATAFTTKINNDKDDLSISSIPNALVLYSPVIDNGPKGYAYNRVKDYYLDFSPIHNISKKAPPTLFLVGTHDHLVSITTAMKYKEKMDAIKSRCDLWFFPKQKHSFINYNNSNKEGITNYNYYKALYETDKFLASLGFLMGAPTVPIPNIGEELKPHLEK